MSNSGAAWEVRAGWCVCALAVRAWGIEFTPPGARQMSNSGAGWEVRAVWAVVCVCSSR